MTLLLSEFVANYGLLILMLLSLSGLWLIPLLYKLIQGDHKYSEMCSRWNIIEHGIGYITWEWNSFSKYLPKQVLSSSRLYLKMNGVVRGIFNTSFGFGVFMSVLLGIICALFLVLHLIYFVWTIGMIPLSKQLEISKATAQDETEASSALIEASMVMLIPGVNLPFNQISLLIVSLIICVVVHEYGHAIAADYQDLRIENFGFSVHYFLPSAYVSIETETLEKKPLFSRLMIYCGGVWHNVLLCFFIGILIFLFFNPTSYFSIIERPLGNNGVFVKSVDVDNPLYHDLKSNDIILSINRIPMKDVTSFTGSYDILKTKRGFSVSTEIISQQEQLYNNKCCLKESDDDGSRLLCFKFANDLLRQGVCMKVRDVTEHPSCSFKNHNMQHEKEHSECMVPDADSGLFILRIKVLEKETDLIYFGTLEQFYHQVIVSDVKVKDFLSFLISLDFVSDLKKFLEYTIALSLGLAVFNLAPVEFLDGAKIYEVLFIYYLRYFAVKKEDIDHVKTIYERLLSVFKVVLILNICVAFINAFRVVI
nr:unnamed protein product [Naegleria fowleri]